MLAWCVSPSGCRSLLGKHTLTHTQSDSLHSSKWCAISSVAVSTVCNRLVPPPPVPSSLCFFAPWRHLMRTHTHRPFGEHFGGFLHIQQRCQSTRQEEAQDVTWQVWGRSADGKWAQEVGLRRAARACRTARWGGLGRAGAGESHGEAWSDRRKVQTGTHLITVVWQIYFCQKKIEENKKENWSGYGGKRDGWALRSRPYESVESPSWPPAASVSVRLFGKDTCVCESVVCSLVLCDNVWQVCDLKQKRKHLEKKNK